ncbi:hypothetical protein ERJ75_000755100 [Trypanosoma vivax]|nr:hypothetical protein ERJ75_000755100 [Trypanosoma vivax]
MRDSSACYAAAMPPVLRSGTTVLSRRSRVASAPLKAVIMECVASCNGDRWPFRAASGGCPFLSSDLLALMENRNSVEIAMLRREIEMRNEFASLRRAEEERLLKHQEERSRVEEYQRILNEVNKIELARLKRVEEQQARIFAQEREIEEWKHERAKAMERERRHGMEEEERSRERRHERELQRLREEAELRVRANENAEDYSRLVEKTMSTALDAVLERLQDKLCENGEEYKSRLNQLQQAQTSELVALRHDVEREHRLIAQSERLLSETRLQLAQVISQLNDIRKLRNECANSCVAEGALMDMHKKVVDLLHREFEDDKIYRKRWFDEELRRIACMHEQIRTDEAEKYRSELRRADDNVADLQQRLRDSEEEAQRLRAKATAATNDALIPLAAEEARVREELRNVRCQLQEAMDARHRADKRATEAERNTECVRSALQAVQAELDATSTRQKTELRNVREEKQKLVDELARMRTAHADEIEQLQKSMATAGNQSHDVVSEFETVCRQMNERYEERHRTLESEKDQLVRQLREIELRMEKVQRQAVEDRGKVDERCRTVERQQQQKILEQECLITELQGTIEELKRKQGDMVDLTAHNFELQQQMEKLRSEQSEVLCAKDADMQQIRREYAEAKGRIAGLQGELSTLQRIHEDAEMRIRQIKEDAELKERQLRRDMEDVKQTAQTWKDQFSQLQAQSTASAANTTSTELLLREKDGEVTRLLGMLKTQKREVEALEQQLHEARRSEAAKEKELLEKETTIGVLNAEIAAMREKLYAAPDALGENATRQLTPETNEIVVATPPHPQRPASSLLASSHSLSPGAAAALQCSAVAIETRSSPLKTESDVSSHTTLAVPLQPPATTPSVAVGAPSNAAPVGVPQPLGPLQSAPQPPQSPKITPAPVPLNTQIPPAPVAPMPTGAGTPIRPTLGFPLTGTLSASSDNVVSQTMAPGTSMFSAQQPSLAGSNTYASGAPFRALPTVSNPSGVPSPTPTLTSLASPAVPLPAPLTPPKINDQTSAMVSNAVLQKDQLPLPLPAPLLPVSSGNSSSSLMPVVSMGGSAPLLSPLPSRLPSDSVPLSVPVVPTGLTTIKRKKEHKSK